MAVSYADQTTLGRVVFDITVGAFLLGELWQSLRGRRDAARVDLVAEVVFRLMFFGAILIFPLGRALIPGATIGGGRWTFVLGALVTWLGLLLRWWSFVTLGKHFTVVLRTTVDQPVVDRGPYRVLRHPSYTGLLLAFAGAGLMWGNWVSTVAALGVLLVALVHRLRIEERALEAALGDRYRQFAARRARLVPYVW